MDREQSPTAGDEEFQDAMFAALSSVERRTVLRHLAGAPEPVPVDRLAREVAAEVLGVSPDELPPDALERTSIALVHVHLPRLSAADLVDWIPGSTEVVLSPFAEGLSLSTPSDGGIFDLSFRQRTVTEE